MIDFPITDLLDDAECLVWLERHLHPHGFVCPHCSSSDRRLFRRQRIPAYRCRACDGYYTIVTGTVFEKTRQRPSTLVLLLRGVAKGEPTARLSRELNLDRKRLGAIRQHLQSNLYETPPADVLEGSEFEADELYQNAGEKRKKAS
jgi:transposase-like protein